jgi:hypothetical protein
MYGLEIMTFLIDRFFKDEERHRKMHDELTAAAFTLVLTRPEFL